MTDVNYEISPKKAALRPFKTPLSTPITDASTYEKQPFLDFESKFEVKKKQEIGHFWIL